MKTKLFMLGILLVVCAIVCSGFGTACAEDAVGEVTGVVTADGEILTDDNEIFIIEENDKGKELMGLVDKQVRVTGIITEDNDGNKVIEATEFEVQE